MTLYLRTQAGREYHVLDTGDIIRLDMPWFTASGQWKMLGLKHCTRRQSVTLSQLRRACGPSTVWPTEMPQLLYKNGNPQWRVVDLDHGTMRVWGDGVVAISRA